MKKFSVGNKVVGMNQPTLIIAEAGVNHNGDVKIAKKLCDAAKNAGADIVKFQTWKTDQLMTPDVKTAKYQKKTTNEISQYEMAKKLELSFDDFHVLSDYCKKIDIIFLTTPEDKESVDFVDSLGTYAFKVGSDDLDNLPLIKHIAKKNKPIIISTGMSTIQEVVNTFEFIKNINRKIAFLHCTSNYPADLSNVNLNALVTMKHKLPTILGYSDHTTKTWVPLIAISLGAMIIEKHITLDKTFVGPDHRSSLDKNEFTEMVRLIRTWEREIKSLNKNDIISKCNKIMNKDMTSEINLTFGTSKKQPTRSELPIMKVVKKTIVANEIIEKGEKITDKNIAIKRAGRISINPRDFYKILGKTTKKHLNPNEIISYETIA